MWNINGDRRQVQTHDIVLLNNEERRRLEWIEPPDDLLFLVLEIEPELLYNSPLLPLFTVPTAGYCHRVMTADQTCLRLLQQIEEEERQSDGYHGLAIAACTLQLLTAIARRLGLSVRSQPVIPQQMRQVIAHIDQHYRRKLPLDELAAIAHMSPTAFSKAFTRCNHIGPAQYIKRKRIALAIRLLEETERTVTDIALECGFSNISNFYKAFHSLTGKAPRDYR